LLKFSKEIKGEDRDKLFLFLLPFVLFIALIDINYIASGYRFDFPTDDGYIFLTVAKNISQGAIFKMYPTDSLRTTAATNNIFPFLESVGFFTGFKSPSLSVLFVYIINFIFLLFTIFFIYNFFSRFNKKVAFFVSILLLLFPSFFMNFFIGNDLAFFMFLFWGAMSLMDRPAFFFTFATLTGFTRPEGPMFFVFLILFRWIITKKLSFKLSIPLFFATLLQYIPNIIINGSLFPSGALAQGLYHYSSFSVFIQNATITFFDQIKGTLLSFFPSMNGIGLFGKSVNISFPIFMGFFFFIGIIINKNKKFSILALTFFLALILEDSITFFSGVQMNRRIIPSYPFVFFFSIIAVYSLFSSESIRKWILYIWSFLLIFSTVGSFAGYNNTAIGNKKYFQLTEYIKKQAQIKRIFSLTQAMRIHYLLSPENREVIHSSPVLNPLLAKCVKYYLCPSETFEVLQRVLGKKIYIINEKGINSFESEFYSKYIDTLLHTQINYIGGPITLALADLTPTTDTTTFFDEVDVCDPISEKKHNYRYFTSLPIPFRAYPLDSDAGRYINGFESFQIKSKDAHSYLFIRLTKKLSGFVLKYPDISEIIYYHLDPQKLKIIIDSAQVLDTTLSVKNTFTVIKIPLRKKGINKVNVEGNYLVTHYWTK